MALVRVRYIVVLSVALALLLATCHPAAADTGAPGPVSQLRLTRITAGSTSVSWSVPTTGGAPTSYLVQYKTSTQSTWITYDNRADPIATSATVPIGPGKPESATPGVPQSVTGYAVKVSAGNGAGIGPASALSTATGVSSGADSSCAVFASGTVDCWGSNAGGQLGNGSTTGSTTPVHVTGITDARSVSVGAGFACAALTTGMIDCWGNGGNGQLGNGAGSDSATPVHVTGITNATSVSAGGWSCDVLPTNISLTNCWGATPASSAGSSACAVLSGGAVACWGSNPYGQLGDGTTADSTTPVQVAGISNATSVSVGPGSACAALSSGGVSCWGLNDRGQLGAGTVGNSDTPVDMSGVTSATSVTVGTGMACALLYGGDLHCTGHLVGGLDATAFTDGEGGLRCAAAISGAVKCWGGNNDGQVGDGTTMSANWPVNVIGITDAASVSAYWDSPCALLRDGAADCWGYNGDGELGDGTTDNSTIPVQVSDPGMIGAPSTPNYLTLAPTASAQTLTWTAAQSACCSIAYTVQQSNDGGKSWATLANLSGSTSATVPSPNADQALEFRVIARDAAGGTASAPAVSAGTQPCTQKLAFQTSDGQPVSGGTVSWSPADGSSSASVSYPLTVDGSTALPDVTPGNATVQVHNLMLPDGVLYTGTSRVVLCTNPQTITLPAEPRLTHYKVVVTLPNGQPAVGATVSATGLAVTQNGFWASALVSTYTTTDSTGTATLVGYPGYAYPSIQVTYDGVLDQAVSAAPDGATTYIQENIPWLTVQSTTHTVVGGSLDTISFSANTPGGALTGHDLESPISHRLGERAGIKIWLTPPAGWKAKRCKRRSKLSGKTNSMGKLTLTLCASVSGPVRVHSSGAVPAPTIMLRVKGSSPMPPTRVLARSYRAGQATITWARPRYAGGARILKYEVLAKTSGTTKTRRFVIRNPHRSTRLRHTFTRLRRGRVCTFTVIAVTKHGRSRPARIAVRIP